MGVIRIGNINERTKEGKETVVIRDVVKEK